MWGQTSKIDLLCTFFLFPKCSAALFYFKKRKFDVVFKLMHTLHTHEASIQTVRRIFHVMAKKVNKEIFTKHIFPRNRMKSHWIWISDFPRTYGFSHSHIVITRYWSRNLLCGRDEKYFHYISRVDLFSANSADVDKKEKLQRLYLKSQYVRSKY